MADRSVKVSLILQASGYMQGMAEVARQTAATGSQIEKLSAQRSAMTDLGTAAVGVGAAFGLAAAAAVSSTAQFDQQMSAVQAATHETAGVMDLLREAAIDAGANTVFSATESAAAIEELAKAGVSTTDILAGGLNGALDLAAAGGLGVAEAASIAAITLQQFQLSGDQATHVADLLAAGAGKAMGDVSDLGNALKFVGPVASAMGVSLEETTGTLALFAQQGIIGEQAGTSLRGVLSSLTAPSAQARGEIERLGLEIYDSSGNFLGLQNAAGQLAAAYTDMDGASRDASLGIIFGRETITAATALYRAGAEGVEEWTAAVDDSGYAQETAATRLDNLKGDWEAFTGALDAAFITMSEGSTGPLRSFVQGLTGIVDGFNDLPEWAQQLVGVSAGAIGLVAGVGGAALLAVPKIADFTNSLKTLNTSMGRVAAIGGVAAAAIAGVGVIVSGLAAQQAEAEQRAQSYADTLEDGTQRITAATRDLVTQNLQQAPDFWDNLFEKIDGPGSVLDATEKLGVDLETVTDAALGSSEAIKDLAPYLERIREGSDFAADEAERLGLSQYELEQAALKVQNGIQGEAESLEEAARLARQKEEATGSLAASTEAAAGVAMTASEAYLAEADAASALGDELSTLIDQINAANGVNQDAITANSDYQQTLADVQEQIDNIRNGAEGYAAGLDLATQAGRDNMDVLQQQADNAQAAAEAQLMLDGDTQSYIETLEAQRQKFIENAEAITGNRDEAERLADQIFQIPTEREIDIIMETGEASNRLILLQEALDGLRDRTVNVNVLTQNGTQATDQQIADQLGFGAGYANAAGNYFRDNEPLQLAAGGFASGIYPYTPGGIHKFAEEYDEAYISMDPARRDRSLDIWAETGRQLGAWQPSPTHVLAAQAAGNHTEYHQPITINQRPGVSDRRIAQVTAEELRFGIKS